jgi:hypothetical protein
MKYRIHAMAVRRIVLALVASVAVAAPLAASSTASAYPAFTGQCSNPSAWESAYTGLFVTAELGYPGLEYGILRARSNVVQSWQVFQTCKFYWNGGYSYGIYSDANGRWVTKVQNHINAASEGVYGGEQLFGLYAGYYPFLYMPEPGRIWEGFLDDVTWWPEPLYGFLYPYGRTPEADNSYYVGWLFH